MYHCFVSKMKKLRISAVADLPQVTKPEGQQGCDLHTQVAGLPRPFLSRHRSAAFLQESAAKCFFGDRCRFLHDVGCYLETKPADLGPRCVLYETFGKCPYGVTCRFAGAHLGPEGQNLVQEPLVQVPLVRNSLDKALQLQLRKREIHFERAERALHQLSKGQLPGSTPAVADPEPVGSEGAAGQDSCAAQQASLGAGAGAPPSASVQTCGPLTDEDVVRLRPCEKKRVCVLGFLSRMPAAWGAELPDRPSQPQRGGAGVQGGSGRGFLAEGLLEQGFRWVSRNRPAEENVEDQLILAEDRGEGLLGPGDRARHVPQCAGKGGPRGPGSEVGSHASLRVFSPSSWTSAANCTWPPSRR